MKSSQNNTFVFIQWERLLKFAQKPLTFCATTRSVLHPTLSVTINQTAPIGLMKLTVVSILVCSNAASSAQTFTLLVEKLIGTAEKKCSFHALR